ncbi:predicted protein [Arabidopsis lyrata subsp. lyrata]|uniref:Predicted protein n=4 Tax=Arabidopsis lyrata subsp. lyrata TaxID=81972 RepID=D7LVS9_ARALL|nr:predicted protein [Arabidopsis lyrata subsp. lyrata]
MANVDLPSRLFADREEPAGDRVNMYFKLNTIKAVLKALTPEELDTIRPCFGKLLDIYSKPVFSAVPGVLSAVGAGTDPESGDEDPFPVIAMKLEPVWDLDGVDEVEVLSVLPDCENVVGIEDCSWPDEVSDPSVDLMLQQLDDGVKFKREMFGGGIRGADVQVESPPRVIVKRKRKLRAKPSECSTSRGQSSRAKKSKVRAARSRFASLDSPRATLDTATALKAALKEAQSDVYAHICVELKSMELRLERSLKENINSAVAAAISGVVVENVLREVGIGVGQPYNKSPSSPSPSIRQTDPQPSPVVVAPENHSDQCQRPSQQQPPLANEQNAGPVEGTAFSESSGSRSRTPADEVIEEASMGGDCGDGQIVAGGDAVAMSANYKKLMVLDIPPMAFGDGLVIKDSELLMIPTIIPPGYPNVMDACVSVLRETLFDNTDPASDPRADLLPCKFYGSLAVLYAKFKKVKRKETFEFYPALINEITTRFKATGRVWLSHIDHLLSPFNIDKNRWIAVHIDLTSHTLTVLDPTAAARRGSRLKPELEFICEMFPYLVRKVGGSDLMKNFPLQPLTFARNTHVSQATNIANSGMLSLLLLEAYATGGMDKAVHVKEDGMRLRAEELVVQMYEHCCGEL